MNSNCQASTPAKLITRTIGLEPQTNRVVFDYLVSLVNRGEIDALEMDLLVNSFTDIKLRVVSSARFTVVAREFAFEQQDNVRITDVEMLKSMAVLEVLLVIKGIPDDSRRETIRKIHAHLVQLFSG